MYLPWLIIARILVMRLVKDGIVWSLRQKSNSADVSKDLSTGAPRKGSVCVGAGWLDVHGLEQLKLFNTNIRRVGFLRTC